MPLKPSRPERSGTEPLARPFLHALTRMQDRSVARPAELTDRAVALLNETYGASESIIEAAFSHGVLGLMSEHTHYFNGYAVLMPVDHGSAVAVRISDETAGCRCVFEAGDGAEMSSQDVDPQKALLARISDEMRPSGVGVEMAVAGTAPAWWWEVSLTSLGVAAVRALQALFARPEDSVVLMQFVRSAVASSIDLPFSIAYPLAADDGRPGVPVLVDTETREHLMLAGPEADELGWGAVHVDVPQALVRSRVRERMQRAAEALEILQMGAFPDLSSYRDLEHRDLERALDALPTTHAPVVRYLVTENRRVQKLVGAVRRRDWQMMGALMLMSHAVQRDDWKMTSGEADHVVNQVEAMSLEGLYGARMSGRSGSVLLAGQPFVIPNFLDRVQSEVRERFDSPAQTLLL